MADTDDSPEPMTVERAHLAIGIDPATGFATDGELPINARLRAERLAQDDKTTDAGGIVSDELIADAKARLAREDAARVADEPSLKWTKEKLVAEAERRGAVVESDANKPAILATILAAPAAPITEA